MLRRRGWTPYGRLVRVALFGAVAGVTTPLEGQVSSAQAGPQSPTAAEVFQTYAPRVGRVEIVEAGSGTKSTVGSAFFVTTDGLLITNYHVVSELLYEPDRYRARLTDVAGLEPMDVSVLGFDVVNDLAVLRVETAVPESFLLQAGDHAVGARVYALGFPADIGLSIVEGTYNGLLAHTLHPRVHFTGSLNPGMSGGPAITEDGTLVGVNVSTAGNQISFLVPTARVSELVDEVTRPGYTAPDEPMTALGQQLHAHQDSYVAAVLQDSATTVDLGPYRVPSGTSELFECWGDSFEDDDGRYEQVEHQCSSGDDIYLSRGSSSGLLRVHHQLLRDQGLNAFQRAALHSEFYQASLSGIGFDFLFSDDELTGRRCEERNLASGALTFRVAFCAQRYLRFEGLYDVVIRAVVLGAPDEGLVSTINLAGIDFEHAIQIMERYVRGISWR